MDGTIDVWFMLAVPFADIVRVDVVGPTEVSFMDFVPLVGAGLGVAGGIMEDIPPGDGGKLVVNVIVEETLTEVLPPST